LIPRFGMTICACVFLGLRVGVSVSWVYVRVCPSNQSEGNVAKFEENPSKSPKSNLVRTPVIRHHIKDKKQG